MHQIHQNGVRRQNQSAHSCAGSSHEGECEHQRHRSNEKVRIDGEERSVFLPRNKVRDQHLPALSLQLHDRTGATDKYAGKFGDNGGRGDTVNCHTKAQYKIQIQDDVRKIDCEHDV